MSNTSLRRRGFVWPILASNFPPKTAISRPGRSITPSGFELLQLDYAPINTTELDA
jgi:hypothetical protein